MSSRYTLSAHPSREGWFRVSDRLWGLHCDFEAHRFNATQEFPDAGKLPGDPLVIARIMRELGDWLLDNHKEEAF